MTFIGYCIGRCLKQFAANWENHAHQSTHEASLTIKTFALSAIVAYLGLFLSAFVYVPFGEDLMAFVHAFFFAESQKVSTGADEIIYKEAKKFEPLPAEAAERIRGKLNASRLQNQMFAYTVTNQAINTFLEVGLPYVMRGVDSVRRGKGLHMRGHGTVFADDPDGDKAFVAEVKEQAALPEYSLFGTFRRVFERTRLIGSSDSRLFGDGHPGRDLLTMPTHLFTLM